MSLSTRRGLLIPKAVILIVALVAYITQAQDQVSDNAEPVSLNAKNCTLLEGYFFCSATLALDQQVQAMQTRGTCCKESDIGFYSQNNLALCTPSFNPLRGIQCTQTVPIVSNSTCPDEESQIQTSETGDTTSVNAKTTTPGTSENSTASNTSADGVNATSSTDTGSNETDSNSTTCVREFNQAQLALFESYFLGMLYDRSLACPVTGDRNPLDSYLDVSGTESFIQMNSSLTNATTEESCYWVIRPERDIWVPEVSNMTVWLESVTGGSLYIYQGGERSNVTDSLIENGQSFAVGAPLELSINDDLLIVFEKESGLVEAGFKIGAQISGRQYPWWEQPFIGVDEAWYYGVVFGVPGFILLTILCCICCCVRCCTKGTCCCRCCNKCGCCHYMFCCCLCKKKSKVGDQIEMMQKNGMDDQEKQPMSKPNKSKLHPSLSQPLPVINERPNQNISSMKRQAVAYGSEEESDGPIPPTPVHAKNRTPREALDHSQSNLLGTRNQQLRVESLTALPSVKSPALLEYENGGQEPYMQPSQIYKSAMVTPDPSLKPPLGSTPQPYRTNISGFAENQRNATRMPGSAQKSSKQSSRRMRNSMDPAVLYDNEKVDRGSKENSSFEQIDGSQYNPDGTDLIDPQTILRFQENTKRLDRLRQELGGGSAAINPVSRGSQNEDVQTIDNDRQTIP